LLLSFAAAGWGAEPVITTEKPAEATHVQATDSTATLFRWRKDPRFEKFVPDPALPEMVAVDKAKLQVGRDLKIDLAALSHLSSEEKESLAKVLHVSPTVVSKFVESFSSNRVADAEGLSKELRACVTDYRFLVHVWNEYVSLEQDSPKKEARQALATGDVEKAWQLYPTPTGGRQKPPPPQNLRIAVDSGGEKPPNK